MSAYDAIAEWYAQSLETGSPVHAVAMPALLRLAGDVEGLVLCDLACGTGVAARELARRGAEVTGIDLSLALLEIARSTEVRLSQGIIYCQGDAQRLTDIPDSIFDGVVCSLALMDIPDLDPCFREVTRILRPGGWFVFTITHPAFQGPESRWTGKAGGVVKREVRGYFREGLWHSANAKGVRGQVGAYHRMLSTIVNALASAGLRIERMEEPQPEDETALRVPGYAEVPVVLAVRCRSVCSEIGYSDRPGIVEATAER
jgi:ubiquinone/menaquinone biosynthesis C-methylase UbiE